MNSAHPYRGAAAHRPGCWQTAAGVASWAAGLPVLTFYMPCATVTVSSRVDLCERIFVNIYKVMRKFPR